MITFVTDDLNEMFKTLGDVEDDQFFINKDGYFCQKSEAGSYTLIADPSGAPLSDTYLDVPSDTRIRKVLPKIRRIEF